MTADLRDRAERYATRWRLRLGEPYPPGTCSWVVPAVGPDGAELVLKVGLRHPEGEGEAAALRVWDGDGAVRVFDSAEDDTTLTLLLERCVPGTPLRDAVAEPEQDEVLAGLLRRLWRRPPADAFEPLHAMCDQWAEEFEQRRAAGDVTTTAATNDAAMALFRSLPRDASDEALLCTDLHAGNVLAARREPWLVIDPKPYVGDRTYDAVQHMLNCQDRLTTDPWAFVRRMAGLLDLDPDRLRQWVFARCVQDQHTWPALVDVAEQLRP